MKRDLYDVLGVARSADADTIRKAYRNLARENHPDLHPDDKAAEERFKEVAVAYEVLSDADKRKAYDEFGDDALNPNFDPNKAREYAQWQGGSPFATSGPGGNPFAAGAGGGVNLDDLFGDLFGSRGGGYGRAMRMKGNDIESTLDVGLLDALRGTEVTFRLTSGHSGETSTVTVKVPPGVSDGDRIRLTGKGEPGLGGGPPGNLILRVKVRGHKLLGREGDNLVLTVPITVSEAILGASITVPTLDGHLTVKVPKGSQTGQKLRLRGQGVKNRRSGQRGDMLLVLEVHAPDGKGEDVDEAARVLEGHYSDDVRAHLEL